MNITTGLALPIVNKLLPMLNYNINIMDKHGVIVASGDLERIGQVHEGALHVLATRQPIIIREEESGSLYGTKPGINVPLELHGDIVGVVGITGDPDEVQKFVWIIKLSVEVMLEQIYMSKQTQYRKMAVENWVMDLINPHEFSEKKLETVGKMLHIDWEIPRCAILVEVEELFFNEKQTDLNWQELNERSEQLLGRLKMAFDYKTICARVDDGLFFLAVPTDKALGQNEVNKMTQLLDKTGFHYFVGIGSVRTGLSGYRESYKEAKQCIRLMKKFPSDKRQSRIQDWGVIRYLDLLPPEVQKALLEEYLPGDAGISEEYLQTLKVYLECDLDVYQTSKALHIHRNTLFYRLDKISQSLGLDYRKFNDLLTMRLMLIFRQLQS